jgi:hypothetical protein
MEEEYSDSGEEVIVSAEDSSDYDSDEESENSEEEEILKMRGEKLRLKLKECALVIPGYEDKLPPWSEVLVITSGVPTEGVDIDDSLALEKHFFQQSMDAVSQSMKILHAEGFNSSLCYSF